MKRVHYTIKEKSDIIFITTGDTVSAQKIAEAIDTFTFTMLGDLSRALRKIRKGK